MDPNPLERAVLAAVLFGGTPEMVIDVGPSARIQLADGAGHLLAGATITAWDDVATGRCE